MTDSVDKSEIWLAQSGDYLYMNILGSSDRVAVSEWFDTTVTSADNRPVGRVEANGYYLDAAAIDLLVAAMSAFGTVNYASPNFTAEQQATVDTMIADAWRPIA